ncbi:hypothetical protein L198_01037 [Cryptococcus wingfieldii CBS 7118]|uniref:Uncharacterized protein n=1 Tax=Cryptococcus wingfieldii CBS 7118 TaxID=1295528 RepID=A0A1E3K2Q3_9TREE|nr:hypothetical protein L198_01037 [Cryptococcus wingfieldii CBS 7118]ODO07458.1 hypothetical protein L198_01037 [Cryptococcus wingfieldii CBS 7118]
MPLALGTGSTDCVLFLARSLSLYQVSVESGVCALSFVSERLARSSCSLSLAGDIRCGVLWSVNPQATCKCTRPLSSLPARFGGLGLLPFNKIAPLAYKSAQEASDSFLAKIDLIHLLDPPPTPTPQRVRCAKLWSEQLSSFMEAATQPERKHLVENASKLGRSWLRQIPYFELLRLSNHEVAAGLHYRLLTPASSPVCSACANESDLGHDEVCRLRETWSIRRHDSINRVFQSYLSRVAGAVVSLEPSTQEGRRRNDLRVRGGGGALRNADYDLKVYGLEDKHMYVVDGRGKPSGMEWLDWVQGRIVAWLSKRDEEVVKKAPRIYGGAFRPLVLSAGGLMSEATAVELRSWRKGMEKEVWQGMQSRVGIELVKARARTLWM